MSEEDKFSLEDGKTLINFARDNIENFLRDSRRIIVPEVIKQKFSDKYEN